MKILAPAKINLALDVLGRDENGYHKIQTVFCEVPALADEVEIFENADKDEVIMDMEISEKNLALLAIENMKKKYGIYKFIKVKIKKNIPVASGLGGGASDAAAVLKGLNDTWELGLSKRDLASIGAEVGMDVPFFIYGGIAIGEHYGEKITPLETGESMEIELFPKSGGAKKTQNAYKNLDLSKCGQDIKKTEALITAIKNKDTQKVIENIHNDFESISSQQKADQQKEHLTGAGPSTFKILLDHS